MAMDLIGLGCDNEQPPMLAIVDHLVEGYEIEPYLTEDL
jgi:hypothetical protein